jgi:hypothetical protein
MATATAAARSETSSCRSQTAGRAELDKVVGERMRRRQADQDDACGQAVAADQTQQSPAVE